MEYLETHNGDPKPFIWTKSAGEILEKIARGDGSRPRAIACPLEISPGSRACVRRTASGLPYSAKRPSLPAIAGCVMPLSHSNTI
jgi:hypothetical protein